MNELEQNSELGKKSEYQPQYNPNLLFPIPRAPKRVEININPDALPFHGLDLWTHYEVSWLNEKGKPMVGIAEIIYDCQSPNLIESKSLKLYFNSFNNSYYPDKKTLEQTIQKDLSSVLECEIHIAIHELDSHLFTQISPSFSGTNLDHLDIECNEYTVKPEYLHVNEEYVEETLYSNLLKSNCLVTHQPDWGSLQICYEGMKINHEGLLKYIVSFRNHNEFHEQCVERIFSDIMAYCQPQKLTVSARYTRRGGIDINPIRSTHQVKASDIRMRLVRQ